MGREARRVEKNLKEPQNKTFWGYVLDSIPCRSCGGTGKFGDGEKDWCVICDGDGKVYPQVDIPAYPVDQLPSYFSVGSIAERFGWQMWETTSEGSPMSPIFDTPEELAGWLADNEASSFGPMTATSEEWLRMIAGPGSAPSAVLTVNADGSGRMVSGVEAVAEEPQA